MSARRFKHRGACIESGARRPFLARMVAGYSLETARFRVIRHACDAEHSGFAW